MSSGNLYLYYLFSKVVLSACNISFDYRDANLHTSKLASSLSVGWPVLARGTQKKGPKVGHAWVYSGVRATVTGTRGNYAVNSLIAIYCNWGWGSRSDGWYFGGSWEQPTSQQYAYLADNQQIYFQNHKPNPSFNGGYAY